MDKRLREKIALVVFAFLVVFAAAVLISYFSTGRSWNVAASFVDDAAGRMDDYVVVAYAGVVDDPAPSSNASATSGDSRSGEGGASDNAHVPPSEESPALEPDEEALKHGLMAPEIADSKKDPSAESDSDSQLALGSGYIGFDDDDALAASSMGLDILSLFADIVPSPYDGVFLSDVRRLYEDKGASVLSLDLARSLDQGIPCIYKVKGKSVGVFSITSDASRAWISRYTSYFEARDVDIVVCVTPRATYPATYEGTDVVIVTSDSKGIPARGYTSGSTFVVGAPFKGQIGVVVLTANNTPSARVVAAL